MTQALDRLYAEAEATPRKMGTDWLDAIRPRLTGQIDLDGVLTSLVDALARDFDADRATVYLVDHAARELVSRAAHLPEIREIRLRLGEGIAGWVGQKGEALRVSEEDADPRLNRRIDATTGYHTRNMLCVPVRDLETTIIAVLQVLNRKAGDFSSADLRRLERCAVDLARVLDSTSLRGQLRADHDKPLAFRFNFIVGESASMNAVYERVERAAATDATVLVRGESGSGKELIARAIHFNSPRKGAPLVKVDCAALPESLVENELFGHEKGAFTGADRDTEGKVASAHGGTLFLDEIGELPLTVQGKLLRLMQERTYLKVGGTKPQLAAVRFVCATHRSLEDMVQAGTFRADLYWRLRVVEIEVPPPLRARGHVDLDRLVDHFWYEFARRHDRPGLLLAPAARASMHHYVWPGNVRELEHCIESAVVLAPGPIVEADQLSICSPTGLAARLAAASPAPTAAAIAPAMPLSGTLREVEAAYIKQVLAACDGNQTAAARTLGIGRNTLARKLRGED